MTSLTRLVPKSFLQISSLLTLLLGIGLQVFWIWDQLSPFTMALISSSSSGSWSCPGTDSVCDQLTQQKDLMVRYPFSTYEEVDFPDSFLKKIYVDIAYPSRLSSSHLVVFLSQLMKVGPVQFFAEKCSEYPVDFEVSFQCLAEDPRYKSEYSSIQKERQEILRQIRQIQKGLQFGNRTARKTLVGRLMKNFEERKRLLVQWFNSVKPAQLNLKAPYRVLLVQETLFNEHLSGPSALVFGPYGFDLSSSDRIQMIRGIWRI